MKPGRVFNGVDRTPLEWRFAGWVVGPLTWVWVALAIFNLAVFTRVIPAPLFIVFLVTLLPLVCAVLYIRWINTINPDIRIKETTAIYLWWSGSRNPRKTTIRTYED